MSFLRISLTYYKKSLHAHEQHIEGGPPSASGLQPLVFCGSQTDYFDKWLQRFQCFGTFNRWTPEQQLNGFMMFLGAVLCAFVSVKHQKYAEI